MINNQVDVNALMSYNNNSEILNQLRKSKNQKNDLHANEEVSKIDEELMDGCKAFETYFVEQVIKEMRQTIPGDEEGSNKHSYFKDLLYREYATAITNQGELGLSKQLYDSMKRNYSIDS